MMIKFDMIITNSKSGDLAEDYCDYVKLTSVKFSDMSLIMDYAFKSGYDVLLRRCEDEDEGEE